MSEITLHLTPEELAHLHEAVEYHFQHSKLARDKARLYGRCIAKLEAAQYQQGPAPDPCYDALARSVDLPEAEREYIKGAVEEWYQKESELKPPKGTVVSTMTGDAPESPQMDTAPSAEAEPPNASGETGIPATDPPTASNGANEPAEPGDA